MAKSIAVAGKGGVGKSTIAALIIHKLCEKNMTPVLAIDADPDANLATLLRINPIKTIGHLKEEMLKKIKEFPAGMTKANYMQAGLHQIISEENDFDLVTMGRAEGPNCYCYLNSLVRKFYDDLSPSYQWTVIDNEAGLEHISRMTTKNIDYLLIVINSNPLSIDSAKSIIQLTRELNNRIKKIYIITNNIPENLLTDVEKKLQEFNLDIIANLPQDYLLEAAIFKGESLAKLADSPAMKSIREVIKKLV